MKEQGTDWLNERDIKSPHSGGTQSSQRARAPQGCFDISVPLPLVQLCMYTGAKLICKSTFIVCMRVCVCYVGDVSRGLLCVFVQFVSHCFFFGGFYSQVAMPSNFWIRPDHVFFISVFVLSKILKSIIYFILAKS